MQNVAETTRETRQNIPAGLARLARHAMHDAPYGTVERCGRLAQLVRAPPLHGGCRGFESLIAHFFMLSSQSCRFQSPVLLPGSFLKSCYSENCHGFCHGNCDAVLLIQFFDGSNIGVRAEIMNISLRHGQTRVSKPFLHRQHIDSMSQPFRCRGVSQVMKPAAVGQFLPMRIPFYVPFIQFRPASRGKHQFIRPFAFHMPQDYRPDLIGNRHMTRALPDFGYLIRIPSV